MLPKQPTEQLNLYFVTFYSLVQICNLEENIAVWLIIFAKETISRSGVYWPRPKGDNTDPKFLSFPLSHFVLHFFFAVKSQSVKFQLRDFEPVLYSCVTNDPWKIESLGDKESLEWCLWLYIFHSVHHNIIITTICYDEWNPWFFTVMASQECVPCFQISSIERIYTNFPSATPQFFVVSFFSELKILLNRNCGRGPKFAAEIFLLWAFEELHTRKENQNNLVSECKSQARPPPRTAWLRPRTPPRPQ